MNTYGQRCLWEWQKWTITGKGVYKNDKNGDNDDDWRQQVQNPDQRLAGASDFIKFYALWLGVWSFVMDWQEYWKERMTSEITAVKIMHELMPQRGPYRIYIGHIFWSSPGHPIPDSPRGWDSGVSGNSRSRPFPGILASDSRSRKFTFWWTTTIRDATIIICQSVPTTHVQKTFWFCVFWIFSALLLLMKYLDKSFLHNSSYL